MNVYTQEDTSIKLSVLRKLPPGKPLGGIREIEDMNRKKRQAVLWLFVDDGPRNQGGGLVRKSYFCVETGDYLGEAF